LKSFADQAVIAIENARLFDEVQARTRDLEESLQQQTATADVLKVISRSTFDLQRVLDTLTDAAVRLCDADHGYLFRLRDGLHYLAASHGAAPDFVEFMVRNPFAVDRGTLSGRVAVERSVVHIEDAANDPDYTWGEAQQRGNLRTGLGVPLLREGAAIGILALYRSRVERFTERQIALVTTFADQAVIAIENARLFNETKEALERQTATADILKVIASSPSNVQPVFEAIAERSNRLMSGLSAAVYQLIDEQQHLMAFTRINPEADAVLRASFPRPLADLAGAERIRNGEVFEITDTELELAEPPALLKLARTRGFRSLVFVPLLREGSPIGLISVTRRERGRFAAHHVDLLRTFAAQAVIAIENVRLFNETKEALERQTATADILKVIANSPTNVRPVFDAIAERSNRLIGGHSTAVYRFVGDTVELVSFTSVNPEADAALRALFPRPLAAFRQFELVSHGNISQMPNVDADGVEPDVQQLAKTRGFRSALFVPLVTDRGPIGLISVTRKETGAFAEHHAQLLRTFADQAVIAIQNVKLFDEVQAKTHDLEEALEYQKATGDVLNVISRSPNNLQPVMDTIVQTARRLCQAEYALMLRRMPDGIYRIAAQDNASKELSDWLEDNPVTAGDGSAVGIVAAEKQTVHLEDSLSDPRFTDYRRQHVSKARTMLGVPLMRNGEAIGVIFLARTQVKPFSDKQIELITSFADQAVIAISNVNLFEEVQAKTFDLEEALRYQTGSANILSVIASSPADVRPVLEAIVESACELCEAYDAVVILKDGGELQVSAHHGPIPMNRQRWAYDRTSTSGRAMVDQQPVHVHDVLSDECLEFEMARSMSRVDGCRTLLAAPLLREGESVGAIALRRAEVHPFTDKQISLLQTFADQAVIAIGNARLFEQVQQRTRQLSKSLDDLRVAQDRLVQTEKLASLGQLTAGIAHEIKNPLNFVNNFSALSAELVDEMTDVLENPALDEKDKRQELDEIRELLKSNLDKVVQHGKRADSIVKNMLLHSRSGSGEHRPVEINAIIDEGLNLAYHGARAEKQGFNISLERDFDPATGVAEVFPQEITRVFLNLISNGFYAATKRAVEVGEGFEPALKVATRDLGDRVEIRIRDNGTGIPPDVKEKIFNPFFTTKAAGEGTGLGLSISHDIVVKQHGGTIDVQTEPGVFTEFIITLPRSTSAQEPAGRAN
jgi:GAF domain-containing protein